MAASNTAWFDETLVLAAGLTVQLEQRTGDQPAAAEGRKRGPARHAKSAAAAVTARTFLVLADDDHNDILDAVKGSDEL